MPVPTAHMPIPPAVRPIVEAAYQRYRAACRRGERPDIDDPRAAMSLVTAFERIDLAACGYYPLPKRLIDQLYQDLADAIPAHVQRELKINGGRN